MFNKLIAAIVGNPEQGQRKMALGTYAVTILGIVLFGCVLGIIFAPGASKGPLLQQVAGGAFTALSAVVMALIAGNIGEHGFKALAGKKSE